MDEEQIRRLASDPKFMAKLRRLLLMLKLVTDELRRLPRDQRQAAALVLVLAIDDQAGGIDFGPKREFYIG